MCGIFGVIRRDTKGYLNNVRFKKLVKALGTAAQVRGKDATGVAYNRDGALTVAKLPCAASSFPFYKAVPEDTLVVTGHTRATTQGDAAKNYNNHPFMGRVQGHAFALAHNGVITNDYTIQKGKNWTDIIETDSYVMVQLLQEAGAISFESLSYMAENVQGSFAVTVLDEHNDVWFVKGDNPIVLYTFPDLGFAMYASTDSIIEKALARFPTLRKWKGGMKDARLDMFREGDIVRLNSSTLERERDSFNVYAVYMSEYYSAPRTYYNWGRWDDYDYYSGKNYRSTAVQAKEEPVVPTIADEEVAAIRAVELRKQIYNGLHARGLTFPFGAKNMDGIIIELVEAPEHLVQRYIDALYRWVDDASNTKGGEWVTCYIAGADLLQEYSSGIVLVDTPVMEYRMAFPGMDTYESWREYTREYGVVEGKDYYDAILEDFNSLLDDFNNLGK